MPWLLCLLLSLAAGAQVTPRPDADARRTLVVEDTGRGSVELGGEWQFRTGDDIAWASPTLDDSAWDAIRVDAPWGAQGHPVETGYAWYRRHVQIRRAAGAPDSYRILIPMAEDAYELYWNGKLIGRYGKLPPHPSWFYTASPYSFALEGASEGVLAIRVWRAPADLFTLAESGGLYEPPLLGDAGTISLHERALTWNVIRQDLFDYSLLLLRTFIAALGVFLWIRNKRQELFLWVGVFTMTPVALGILQDLFLIPFSYEWARAINQPIYALSNISLWFLLISLLQLKEKRSLVYATRVLAVLTLAAGVADGLMAFFWGSATRWMQWADGTLLIFMLLAELLPFLLIFMGLRRRQDASRWVVAAAAFVSQLLQTCADASALGRRFTHWTLYERLIDNHDLQIQGTEFRPQKLSAVALFVAILYAVYRFILDQQARRTVLEQEIQSAREIQRVLIPDTLLSLEGYAITSAYTPALEVGGDFFQIIPTGNGSTLVAVGDVSGKGLKAAMNVSMILGILSGQATRTSSPGELLQTLNTCLVGRMQGGFATSIVFRLDPDGMVTFANAGHLPPFLNGKEFLLEPSLPLGLSGYAAYIEETAQLHLGDQLSFYTDGLLEARNSSGELYGFERLHTLFAARPTAQEASAAAVEFGQDDDITVLTITRLAAGQESTTLLLAPNLDEAAARIEFA